MSETHDRHVRSGFFVDGAWVGARAERTRVVENPHDGSALAEVPEGDRDDARAAIAAARRAFDAGPWPHTTGPERAVLLRRLGTAVRAHADELARLETLDTGKTLEESRWDMADVASVFDYYAGLADDCLGDELIASPRPDSVSAVQRAPAGACGLILPWNYPLLQASWKLAPALAAGCTVVVKPSELTPLTTLRLTELAAACGLPNGVFNTVLGPGPTVGAELAESEQLDLVSFTGGVATGQAIMRAAAGNLKRVALELGGKNPHIVFADADLETAVDHILNGCFFHAGQVCSAGTRLLVEDAAHDGLVEALTARIARIVVGNGLDPETQMGPLISAAHRERVEGHLRHALAQGATLVTGGGRPASPALARGYYLEPTLLAGVTTAMDIARTEVFGPVVTVERFSDEAEAVRLANDTTYGLAAGVRSGDPARLERVARALRFGTVWLNDYNVYFAQAPWGGFKRSGIGRELGQAGLDEYTELRHVYRSTAPKPLGWFGR